MEDAFNNMSWAQHYELGRRDKSLMVLLAAITELNLKEAEHRISRATGLDIRPVSLYLNYLLLNELANAQGISYQEAGFAVYQEVAESLERHMWAMTADPDDRLDEDDEDKKRSQAREAAYLAFLEAHWNDDEPR